MTKKSLREQVEGMVVADETRPTGGLSGKVEKTRSRRKSYVMDLRIQSPTALGYLGIEGIDTAPALVRLAKVKGIDVIAVTDYYSGTFIDRLAAAAADSVLTVIPGVVVRAVAGSCDDVVLACLFPEEYRSAQIKQLLARLKVPASAAGDPKYVVRMDFGQMLATIEAAGGIVIPSRMDKTPYRKAAIRGLVEQYGFRAFDLAYYPESVAYFKATWPRLRFQLFSFSNASALAQVGSRISKIKMADPGFVGLRSIVERTACA
jgi:hypothetical protein